MKYTLLTLAAMTAMTGASSASYTILSTSVDVDGTTYANTALSGVNLGSFLPTDTLLLDGTAATPVYGAEVLNQAPLPAGASTSDNYIHVGNNDGATVRIIVDGATVSTQSLALTVDPGGNKGTFGWGDAATLTDVDLIGAVGGAVGAHTVTYEIDYTFTNWDGADTPVPSQIYAPLSSSASFVIVPEPTSAALLGLGGLALLRRRRK